MKDLAGKVVLITGATRGEGREIAEFLAAAGCVVCINFAHDSAAARNTLDALTDLGAEAEIFRADVSDEEEVEALFGNIAECFQNVDMLVNCARVSPNRRREDMTDGEWFDKVFAVAVKGTWLCCKTFAEYFPRGKAVTLLRTNEPENISALAVSALKNMALPNNRFLIADTQDFYRHFPW